MNTVVLLVRLALVLIFGLAGGAKLADLQGSRDTVEAFGVPRRLAAIVGSSLPFAELMVAIALLVQPLGRWAAVAAALLLIAFTAGVAVAIAHGRTPKCNCFGQVSSEQISRGTIGRNSVFIVAAGLVAIAGPGASVEHWTGNLAAANLIAVLAVVAGLLCAVAAVHFALLSREFRGDLAVPGTQTASSGLRLGAQVPRFELPDLSGAITPIEVLLTPGRPLLLMFGSPICAPCAALLPQLSRWSVTLSERLRFAVVESITSDPEQLASQVGAERGELTVMVEPGLQVATDYGVSQTPTAFLIRPDGRLAAAPAMGAGAIEQLIRGVLQTSEYRVSEVA